MTAIEDRRGMTKLRPSPRSPVAVALFRRVPADTVSATVGPLLPEGLRSRFWDPLATALPRLIRTEIAPVSGEDTVLIHYH